MDEILKAALAGQKVLLLGFGREGKSSYQLIRKVLPGQHLYIADINPVVSQDPLVSGDPDVSFITGTGYMNTLEQFDVIVKSPGITLLEKENKNVMPKITSQTDLFLRRFSSQVIGVTGTKGKSTTASLIYHLLVSSGIDSVLLGNIGAPSFHFADQIKPGTCIVFELSSHQLEHVRCSPHIAVLLNFFQEHLDAYESYLDYRLAKMNIARYQHQDDLLIFNVDDPLVSGHVNQLQVTQQRFPFSGVSSMPAGCFMNGSDVVIRRPGQNEMIFGGIHNRYLKGDHNMRNIQAAVCAVLFAGAGESEIPDGLDSFKGLAHRMEYVGFFHGIHFYNDSIATIPEACMAAIRSIPNVDTLVAGGFDRGIDYSSLALFLGASGIRNLILTGAAGRRIGTLMKEQGVMNGKIWYIDRFEDFLPLALKYTRPGAVCILSPAAASYDEFRSFEERGMKFVQLVKKGTTE